MAIYIVNGIYRFSWVRKTNKKLSYSIQFLFYGGRSVIYEFVIITDYYSKCVIMPMYQL